MLIRVRFMSLTIIIMWMVFVINLVNLFKGCKMAFGKSKVLNIKIY